MYYGNRVRRITVIVLMTALLFVAGFETEQQEVGQGESVRKEDVQEETVQLDKMQDTVSEKKLIASTTDMPQLVTVTRGKIQEAEYYQGEINPAMEVLQFPRKGVFGEYRVMLGDNVKKGQILAVTQPEYKQEIKDAKEHLEKLIKDHDDAIKSYELGMLTNEWQVGRLRKLIESMDADMPGFENICITFELTMAEGRKIDLEKKQFIEKSEKEIAFWQAKLARLEAKNETNIITAPIDGCITYLADLKVGDPVSVNSYPIVIADTSTCLVQCEYISVIDMEDIKFSYGVKDGKNYDMTYRPYAAGEYERKNAKGEGVYTFFEVISPDDSISFGEDILVVTVTKSKENVLIIPTQCIHNDTGEDYVYCDKNGKKEAVPIEIGMSDDIHTEILSGLTEGDVVYVSN